MQEGGFGEARWYSYILCLMVGWGHLHRWQVAGEKQESRVRKECAQHQRTHFFIDGQISACP